MTMRDLGRGSKLSPSGLASGCLVLAILALIAFEGLHDVAQTGLNGLALGAVYALGAIGLTLVYGILRLVNFAQGDFLTVGAYTAVVVTSSLDLPLVIAAVAAMVVVALIGVLSDLIMWGPMRRRGGKVLQLLLMSIGLAFVIRNVIQLIWGSDGRHLNVDTTGTVQFLGLRLGTTAAIVTVVGFGIIVAVGLMLRKTMLGKQMRALSDDFDLAEIAGINTGRVVVLTWIFAGALAGLAGVLDGAVVSVVQPNLGFALLLPIFGAVILGGIGNPFGALAGGLALGILTEWSTLLIDFRWKLAVSFAILVAVLLVRPQGIFGGARLR